MNGTLERADAKKLVDPVPPKTSALTAQVWFLYRLAGLGEWSTFTAAYRQAGFTGKEAGSDVATKQAVRLAAGSDLSPYQLTAAALAVSGLLTGRYTEPNESYRGEAMAAIMEHCEGVGESSSSPVPSSGSRTTESAAATTTRAAGA
ncbi:hypothetical protein AXK58_21290 [Tsukamurella tyrosinosolvens]|nr:hypothetical protein AXK58_21290 [Tsukamurella tyrosinosolvens]